MSLPLLLFRFLLPLSLAFFLSQISLFTPFIPQIIALLSLIIILYLLFANRLSLFTVIFTINLVVLSSGAINSSLLFLTYFLLFTLSFQYPPLVSLFFSLFTIITYLFSLDSFSSLIKLSSLLLITPLTYFISHQQEENQHIEKLLSQDETDFLLWISLQLKSSLNRILSLSDNPKIRKIVKDLLKDSQKLSRSIDQNSDEI